MIQRIGAGIHSLRDPEDRIGAGEARLDGVERLGFRRACCSHRPTRGSGKTLDRRGSCRAAGRGGGAAWHPRRDADCAGRRAQPVRSADLQYRCCHRHGCAGRSHDPAASDRGICLAWGSARELPGESSRQDGVRPRGATASWQGLTSRSERRARRGRGRDARGCLRASVLCGRADRGGFADSCEQRPDAGHRRHRGQVGQRA